VNGLSNVTIEREGTVVYNHDGGFAAPAHTGLSLAAKPIEVVGSNVAVLMRATAGHHKLTLRGTSGTVVCSTPDHKLACAAGMRIVLIEQVAFGSVVPPATCGESATIRCAAGSSRHHVEQMCLGSNSCTLSADAQLFDPAQQLPEHCRGYEAGDDAADDGGGSGGVKTASLYVQARCGNI
jgi:hypothetical protein